MAKVWFCRDGDNDNPTDGGPRAGLPLDDCAKTLSLTGADFIGDLTESSASPAIRSRRFKATSTSSSRLAKPRQRRRHRGRDFIGHGSPLLKHRMHRLGSATMRERYIARARKRLDGGHPGKNDAAIVLAAGG